MSDQVRIVEIDRIRLTDLETTPERAERIRALLEVELQRLLERGGWSEGLTSGELSRLDASAMHVNRPYSDRHLAHGLAQSIAQTLRSVGKSDEGRER